MELTDARILVTGGAGFVGSHLASALLPENDVVVVDDLSNGDPESVPEGADFIGADLTDPDAAARAVSPEFDVVFHLAAASKSVDTDEPRAQFEDNVAITHNLLESMRDAGLDRIAFTSSSTVYGEAPRPTPEDYAPLEPISEYGAAKLAEEGLLSTYAHSYGFTVWVFRFANIVGPRLRGAVIPDFLEKLGDDPGELVILGDGRQEKSYMHIDDCVGAMRYVVESADAPVTTVNLGTRTTTSVTRVADIVVDEAGLDPRYEFTGGDRGWVGDVPRMQLSIEKLRGFGWEPSGSSDDAVRRAARDLLAEFRRSGTGRYGAVSSD